MSLTNSSSLPRSDGSHSLKIHPERPTFSRLSLRNPQRDEQVAAAAAAALRQRTFSASEDGPEDTITELVSPSPLTTTTTIAGGKVQPTPVDRRNSSPQIHIGSIFSQAFQKKTSLTTKLKEEIHSAHSSHQSDRLNNSNSKISVMANQNPLLQSRILPSTEKLTNGDSPQFIRNQCSMKPRSADSIRFRCNANLCIAKIYRELFYDYFHINYYGESGTAGPFLASARYINKTKSQDDSYVVHLIIRTAENNHYMVEALDEFNKEHILPILFDQANVSSISAYGPVGDSRANEKIYQFDKTNDERQNCKIGVIFQRRGQTDESDILSNDELSDEMIEFFELIAERISLKGFDKYRADLDTKEDLHGDHSYYTEFNNHEIMFNIAPIIPSFPVNGQYIERKSLVGNAFVCIVFQEMNATFNPNDILGRVTQIYITVQPIFIDRELFYKIDVWRRNEITSVLDPPGGIFRSDASFSRYFLTLLLNCVQQAIESPNLRGRVFEARQTGKSDELKKLLLELIRSPLPDFDQDQEIFSFGFIQM